ncbi:hypothetical protein EJ08DRAFT_647979 [Tothia fuscella]|uniref:Uncharacterized protein n=1 Tax=Tothia fuscella TaxID=1048955 RepID=A0A9P4U118_9PEZI|nr:hypothetical protein EJ08DRAFT_647979 [Tothia fuscella]
MAPPTDSHKYWKRLRALGLVLDLAALIIIIIAGNRVHQGFYGLIGIGLYFSIVINLMGLFPNIPDEELYRWNPVFGGNLRHVLRIGFELLGVLLIVAGAVLYATLQSVKTVPLASIGAVVGFSLVAYALFLRHDFFQQY